VFYDDTKEGGCTTTVHADEPGETNGNNETDDNDPPILEERKLVIEFGDSYIRYQKEVPMLIPFTKWRTIN